MKKRNQSESNLLKKCLIVFGTRPEAIKFAPIISEMETRSNKMKKIVCVTGQHREMLDDVLECFSIIPDYDLNVMKQNQTLTGITCHVLQGLEEIVVKENPDICLVQGDTTTAFIASLVAYYHCIPVGHVEAGLRSGDRFRPFPEEMNRRLVDVLSDIYFAPTVGAKNNLLKEGISEEQIQVTGNTVVDALLSACDMPYVFDDELPKDGDGRIILVTAHRRESFGSGISSICHAVGKLARLLPDMSFVFPVHRNPNVSDMVHSILQDQKNVILIGPLPYLSFVHLMKHATLILSDSGGIQEEVPSLNVPLLILRDITERPEVIKTGAAVLVGTDTERIVSEVLRILGNSHAYKKITLADNPFGDGKASKRIVSFIDRWLSIRSAAKKDETNGLTQGYEALHLSADGECPAKDKFRRVVARRG